MDLDALASTLADFAGARDWDQFHSPKNLAMALVVETGELLEYFQWLSEEQSFSLSQDDRNTVSEEVADILIYLVRLADKLDIDIPTAVERKLAINEKKYPADKVRGSADKYTKYEQDEKG
ncbi:nucleotide pyrophosphohydrolase [Lentisalinibacter sediminis]|uniref:nucleotide pyrophosphohydrolase n=1 Tax=Lentisalinibacter sediminis TaxID=2992237 RepID=UPI00386B7161